MGFWDLKRQSSLISWENAGSKSLSLANAMLDPSQVCGPPDCEVTKCYRGWPSPEGLLPLVWAQTRRAEQGRVGAGSDGGLSLWCYFCYLHTLVKNCASGISLAVHWLRFPASVQRVWRFEPWWGKLISHIPGLNDLSSHSYLMKKQSIQLFPRCLFWKRLERNQLETFCKCNCVISVDFFPPLS